MLNPTGYHVIVEPDPVETKTEAGIILQIDTKKEKAAGTFGTLKAVGPQAWKDISTGDSWAKVGERVMYAKYAGTLFADPNTGVEYVLLNDKDILGRDSE
jgi:co-chaperonin GroES (HSP10)